MHGTWRATLAHLLLATAILLALGLAVALSVPGFSPALPAIGWTVVLLLVGSGFAAWADRREAVRLRRCLALGLTHHLRTSLSHVQTFNEMLLLRGDISVEQRQEWLEVVGREAQRLGLAVENLLFLMNDSHEREFPIRQPVDLGNLLEDVACDRAPPPERHLQLDVNPRAGILVDADAAALRHALGNLLEGAVRTARDGSTISTTATAQDGVASVVVLYDPRDGEGERKAGHWSMLDRTRLEGCTADGFGLELAVVRHFARQHGGRADRFHELERSGFRIELPLSRA